MKKILCAVSAIMMAAGAAQAVLVDLDLPAAGNHASGSTFSTAASFGGATFDIEYTLNAFATSNSPAPSIRSAGTYFGVQSPNDTSGGQRTSIDGDDGEQVSITGLSINNFVAGGSGLGIGDLSMSFESVTILNGTASQDGVALSFVGFGTSTTNVSRPGFAVPAEIDLTALDIFSSTATSLFLEPDNVAGTNRWSVSGIEVDVIPEPATLVLVMSAGGILYIRRRFKI